MACKHCRYSIGADSGLWCWLFGKQALEACKKFEREPGVEG